MYRKCPNKNWNDKESSRGNSISSSFSYNSTNNNSKSLNRCGNPLSGFVIIYKTTFFGYYKDLFLYFYLQYGINNYRGQNMFKLASSKTNIGF